MKILVTGNAGSGKTTAVRRIAAITGDPIVSLDSIVWQPGWTKTPDAERRELEREIAARPSWVVDGVSDRIRRAASIVVFLDYPRRICLLRCFCRNIPYLFRSRPELPERCPEIKIIPKLLRIIWMFPKRVRAEILRDQAFPTFDRRFVHVTNKNDLEVFLSELRSGS